MSTSVLPDVKARILELLAGDPDADGVQLSWARPADVERESIYFGRSSGQSAPGPLVAGRKIRDESFSLTLIIQTFVPGSDAETAERRAAVLYAVVENLCANDITLVGARGDDVSRLDDITGLLAVRVTNFETGPEGDIEGYVGTIAVTLDVTAQLN